MLNYTAVVINFVFVNLFFSNGIFSHYSHWVSSQFVQVFLTSVSKYDFFLHQSVVDSNKSYSSVVVHSQF